MFALPKLMDVEIYGFGEYKIIDRSSPTLRYLVLDFQTYSYTMSVTKWLPISY
jgi:hypothetical protein